MLSYIIKIVTLIIFWGFTVFSYYKLFPFHVEWFSPSIISAYFIPLIVIYTFYKILSFFVFNDSKKDEIEMSNYWVISYSLIHLLLLCIVYFNIKEWFNWWEWVWLFFKILWFLVLPITIFSASFGFWNKILSYIKWFEKEESAFRYLSSIWFWFFSFIALLHTFAFIGFYNIYAVLLLLIWFIGFSYKTIWTEYVIFFTKKFTLKKDINLYTSEFLFVVITALISTNLILVFRPFPIWWDDLWAYMNYPHLLASAWKLITIWWMQAWEIFTWIWFIFWSTTQAFYLNTFSWFIAAYVVFTFSKSFFHEKNEFINIPLLLVAIFLSMPMVIFQLGKDMKLDIWLFSISLIAMYMIYYIFVKKEEFIWEEDSSIEENNTKLTWKISNLINKVFRKEFFKKEDFYYMFIVWIIVWFAFAIKLTTLMLVSAIIWLILFSRIWFDAFMWYFAIYFAVFTKLKLWDLMNVVYPKNDIVFINTFSLISFLLWVWLLGFAYYRHNKTYILKTLQILWIFLLWVLLALLPWLTKNIYQAWITNINVWTLLWWKAEYYTLDYKKIMPEEKIKEIEKLNSKRQNLDENWQALNADMWRYFWYERWINNYLKLPYNLSMQSNQRGEYTDITYIFFALLPVLFLFIPLRKNWYYIWIYWLLLFEVLYYISPWASLILTNFFNNIELPLWYAIIFWLFISLLFFFKITTDWRKDKILKLLIVNVTFTVFYVFLWNIAAFWIVWYWISMYMCFLIFIWIWIHYITKTNKEIDWNDNLYILKVLNFFAVFIIISIYFVKSSIPHIFSNFNEDSYMHYKSWFLQEDEAIFAYHGDYLNILFELNIKEESKNEFIANYKKEVYDFFAINNYPDAFKTATEQITDINRLNELLSYFIYSEEMKKSIPVTEYWKMTKRLSEIRTDMYKNLITPKKEIKSDAIIYRMWTFLKYFITENNYRLVEDSLIYTFSDFIYNKDINKTIDNFKNLGMEYIIVDLNTPTIDKDPTHALTDRFENLLKTFTSDRLKVVDSDSICLRTAIDLYNKTNKTPEDLDNYVRLAWVNFESYNKDNTEITRTNKLIKCYDVIFYLFDKNLVDNTNFPYLIQIRDDFKNQKFTENNDKYNYLASKISAWYKAVFKIIK